MNFKINLWTLLFFISSGISYYSCSFQRDFTMVQKQFIVSKKNCDPGPDPGVIQAETAIGRIGAFDAYLDSINITGKGEVGVMGSFDIPIEDIPEENRKVRGFYISHPCELSAILENADSLGPIFAVLSLEKYTDDTGAEKGRIDLMFAVKTNSATPVNPIGPDALANRNTIIDRQGYMYFDFTRPCPPTCDSIPVFPDFHTHTSR